MNLEESPFSTKDGDFLDNKYKKEGWQSFVVLAVMLLVFGSYMLSESAPAYQNVLQFTLHQLAIAVGTNRSYLSQSLGQILGYRQLPHKNHDRFLIIDDKVYLMGASLKDMGAGLCAITEMQASPETIVGMLK